MSVSSSLTIVPPDLLASICSLMLGIDLIARFGACFDTVPGLAISTPQEEQNLGLGPEYTILWPQSVQNKFCIN